MAPKKTTTGKEKDRHKPRMTIGIPMPFALQLEKLAARNVSSATEEVRRAVREYLERQGLWPPADEEEVGGDGAGNGRG